MGIFKYIIMLNLKIKCFHGELFCQVVYESGVSYTVSLIVLTCLWSIVILDSLFLFPRKHATSREKTKDNIPGMANDTC